jgi:hypothetical protein
MAALSREGATVMKILSPIGRVLHPEQARKRKVDSLTSMYMCCSSEFIKMHSGSRNPHMLGKINTFR